MHNFLLVSDDNYIKGLIAQINSVYLSFPDARIYLVHSLNPKNLRHVLSYVYHAESFIDSYWSHLPKEKGHVTRIAFGKFQTSMIKSDSFCYLDTDVIINKRFEFGHTNTMSLDVRSVSVRKTDKYYQAKMAIKLALKKFGIEDGIRSLRLFTSGAYLGNPAWIYNTLMPEIKKATYELPETSPRWFDMGFFQVALGRLGRPVANWHIRQFLAGMDSPEDLADSHLIHYLGSNKPWMGNRKNFTSKIWFNAYHMGPVSPL